MVHFGINAVDRADAAPARLTVYGQYAPLHRAVSAAVVQVASQRRGPLPGQVRIDRDDVAIAGHEMRFSSRVDGPIRPYSRRGVQAWTLRAACCRRGNSSGAWRPGKLALREWHLAPVRTCR